MTQEILVALLIVAVAYLVGRYRAARAPRVDAHELRRLGRHRGWMVRSMRPGMRPMEAAAWAILGSKLRILSFAMALPTKSDGDTLSASEYNILKNRANYAENLLDYSADPTGVLDSTNAINSAFTAGDVFAPAGTYLVSSTVTFPVDRALFGVGRGKTIFKLIDNADDTYATAISVFQTATSGNFSGAWFTVDGNRAGNPDWPIVGNSNYGLAVRCQGATVFDVEAKNVTGNGMGVPTTAERVSFIACHGHDNGKKGFHSGDVGRITVVDGFWYSNETDSGLGMHSGIYDTIVKGNHCYDNGTQGIEMGDADGIAGSDSRFNTISGNILEGNTQNGLYLYADDSVNTDLRIAVGVSGNIIRNNTLRGIEIVGARHVTIGGGNVITGNAQHGILVSSCDDISMGINQVYGNNTSGGASELAEIFIRGVAHGFGAKTTTSRVIMIGTNVRKASGGSTRAVSLGTDASECIVALNIFSGFTGLTALRNYGGASKGHVILANISDGTVEEGGGLLNANRASFTSTNGGIVAPRLTTAQRDAIGSPTNGEFIYNTTTDKLQIRAAGAWVDLH